VPSARTITLGGSVVAIILTVAVPQIQKFEGQRLLPYRDIVGVLTVCDGHTGPDVKVRKKYTPAECTALTDQDATKAAEGILKVSPQLANHPMQLAAAISFSYNVGVGTYDKSSVKRDFNAGKYKQGCADLMKYVYAGDKYSDGLYNRRKDEYAICMKGLT
jgi:lysozyme